MAKSVYCDICGKLYNSSSLSTHKRLAHRIDKSAGDRIVILFKTLSVDDKKKVLAKLTSITQQQEILVDG
jgi:hypothetical protein